VKDGIYLSENGLNKILFMGLAIAGKSSIYSIVFEGKNPKDVEDYEATQNYLRTGHEIFNDNFQILDLGGQESFLSLFVGDMAEFIFSDVSAFIWVTDVSDSEHVSISKFYFDKAIEKLDKYSKNALIFCLFHKMDKIQDKFKDDVLKNMTFYFKSPIRSSKINYFPTSIYDKSIFEALGTVLIELLKLSKKKSNQLNIIRNVLNESELLLGLMLHTNNCLPFLKEGREIEKLFMVSKGFCSTLQHIQATIGNQNRMHCNFETDEFTYLIYKYDSEIFVTCIFNRKISYNQIVEERQKINNLLKEGSNI
jgi:GTPase SAR1 family protein